MEFAGFAMLALVALGLVLTGLPAFLVLLGVAAGFAALGVATGEVPYPLLAAIPVRIVGLLESDILQALPLYVLMGALLDRLPLADIVFRAVARCCARTNAAPSIAAVVIGALLAPMSGSVGASVTTLARIVYPKLVARQVAVPHSFATICAAGTFGVVVPPSLVLILLGDAMLRAHSEAIGATGAMVRAINTSDVFHGAVLPAALFLALALAWASGRRAGDPADGPTVAEPALSGRDWLLAAATLLFLVGLLTVVALGRVYAVEGAAAGASLLFLGGIASGRLRSAGMRALLRDTMTVSGALFALFVAATSFTLVFRSFGSDRLLTAFVLNLPGGPLFGVVAVLGLLGLCALVLDAFEIIFLVIPLLMPPLLTRAPDAVWVAVLTLLALQASFLLPPFGYAIMTARTQLKDRLPLAQVIAAVAPFLAAQLAVLLLVLLAPGLVHVADPAEPPRPTLSDEDVMKQFQSIVPEPQ